MWHEYEHIDVEFDDLENPDNREHRFYLNCSWDENKSNITFIMLNPSSSDEKWCDDTVEGIIELSKNKYGSLEVVNLFSKIDPDSSFLSKGKKYITKDSNAIFLEKVIENASKNNTKVVLAWGGKGHIYNANVYIYELLKHFKVTPYCLGTLKYNEPIHPGRKKKGTLKLQQFNYSMY